MIFEFKNIVPFIKDRDTIIFIHGYTESAACFESIKDHLHLFKNYNLISFDLPGFGKNTLKEENLKPTELINELKSAICNVCQNEKIILVGHSLGGAIAILLAETLIKDNHDTILICIDPLVSPEKNECSSIAQANNYDSAEEYHHFAQTYWSSKTNNNKWLLRYLENIKRTPPETLHQWAKFTIKLLENNHVSETLSHLQTKTIIICGDQSINSRNIEAIESLGLPISWISECGHWPMLERPDFFWEKIQSASGNT